MNKHIFICPIIILILIILVGCSHSGRELLPPNGELLEFLPSIKESYVGDSGYYHVVQKIDRDSTKKIEMVTLIGEVKDNGTASSNDNFHFEIVLTVEGEELVQTYSGSRLNESNFEKLILLKSPIEVGNTWLFTTKDKFGSKLKVTGEITAINTLQDEVAVKYTTKDGYYEERVLQKGRGVTDFLRVIIFKKESTFTGYHAEKIAVSSTEKTTSSVESVKIPVAYYNLILGFEQAWSGYVKQDNDDLLKFISVDSPAYEKIKAVPRDASTAIEFVRFYPYDMSEVGSILTIKVAEIFKTDDEALIENRVRYQIVIEKGAAKIYDFMTDK